MRKKINKHSLTQKKYSADKIFVLKIILIFLIIGFLVGLCFYFWGNL